MIVRNLETIDFRTLSIFVTSCRLLSLTKCALELNLPKSTVSKAITKLEQHFEAKLLERTTRKLVITEAGQMVLERAASLVEEFHSIGQDVQEMEQQIQGRLRIAAPPALDAYMAEHIFLPFLKQWPKVQIALEASNDFVDLFSHGFDMAIRVGQIVDDRLIAKKLGYTTRVLAASPEYLAECGVPKTPEDLTTHNCLRYQYVSEIGPWTLISQDNTVNVSISSNFSSTTVEAVLKGALKGLGIANLPMQNMTQELENGSLVRVLPQWHTVPMPIYLVYRPGANRTRRVQAMIDHIMSLRSQFEFGPRHGLCCGEA
ncbi:LysR family transcriptional regulator [Vibrio chemaguriensis]